MDLVAFNCPSDPAIQKWRSEINAACAGTKVPPCLLAAIVKRETNGQNIFQIGMPRGTDCGVGLAQITYGVNWADKNHPTLAGLDLTVPSNNLRVAVQQFLTGLINDALAAQQESPVEFGVSCRGQVAYAVACGYNAGFNAVEQAMAQGVDADTKTTNDYAAEVYPRYLAYAKESHR